MAIFYTKSDQGSVTLYRLRYKYKYFMLTLAAVLFGFFVALLFNNQFVSAILAFIVFILMMVSILDFLPMQIALVRASWRGKKSSFQRVDGYWQSEIEK